MPGLCDYPASQAADRVQAVSKALCFLATATGAIEDVEARGAGNLAPEDYEGLTILLRACAETLEDVERQRQLELPPLNRTLQILQ